MLRKLLIVALVLAAVGGFAYSVIAILVSYFFPRQAYDEPLKARDDLRGACSSTYYPQADAYTGTGPHPMAVFQADQLVYAGVPAEEIVAPDSPKHWSEQDPERIQLVLCIGPRVQDEDGGFVSNCEYANGEVLPLYRGIYRAILYEARTGRQIATRRLTLSRESCPGVAVFFDTTDRLFAEPDYTKIPEIFGKYIDN